MPPGAPGAQEFNTSSGETQASKTSFPSQRFQMRLSTAHQPKEVQEISSSGSTTQAGKLWHHQRCGSTYNKVWHNAKLWDVPPAPARPSHALSTGRSMWLPRGQQKKGGALHPWGQRQATCLLALLFAQFPQGLDQPLIMVQQNSAVCLLDKRNMTAMAGDGGCLRGNSSPRATPAQGKSCCAGVSALPGGLDGKSETEGTWNDSPQMSEHNRGQTHTLGSLWCAQGSWQL